MHKPAFSEAVCRRYADFLQKKNQESERKKGKEGGRASPTNSKTEGTELSSKIFMAGAAGSFKSMFSEVKSILTLLMKKKVHLYITSVCGLFRSLKEEKRNTKAKLLNWKQIALREYSEPWLQNC